MGCSKRLLKDFLPDPFVTRTTAYRSSTPAMSAHQIGSLRLVSDAESPLDPGTLVKVRFAFEPRLKRGAVVNAEVMWVEVMRRSSDGTYVGLLRNEPEVAPQLHYGQRVA